MKADEILTYYGIEECPECHCAVGNDWEYLDFSNKMIVECPQCKSKIYIEELEEQE